MVGSHLFFHLKRQKMTLLEFIENEDFVYNYANSFIKNKAYYWQTVDEII